MCRAAPARRWKVSTMQPLFPPLCSSFPFVISSSLAMASAGQDRTSEFFGIVQTFRARKVCVWRSALCEVTHGQLATRSPVIRPPLIRPPPTAFAGSAKYQQIYMCLSFVLWL